MTYSHKPRRTGLVRLWTWSLAGLALLLPWVTWWIPQKPEELALASAQAELQLLLPGLELEVRRLADDLIGDEFAANRVFQSALNANGALLHFPQRQAPLVLDHMGRETAAFGWYRDGLEQIANPEVALLALQEAAKSCPEDSIGLALQIDLARIPLLQETGEKEFAVELLERWLNLAQDSWTLRGRPASLILAYRLLEIEEGAANPERVGILRAKIRQNLLSGRWPLSEQEVRMELSFLAPAEEGQLSAEVEARLARDLGYRQLLQSLPAKVPSGVTVLDGELVLIADVNRSRAVVYPVDVVHSLAEQRLQSRLGADSSFVLASVESMSESPSGLSAFVGANAVGLPGWQIRLHDVESYIRPIRRQQQWMFAGACFFSLALIALLMIGRRMFARDQLLQQTRSDFLAGVSHELRTPAASLSMLAENLLEERVSGKERLQEYYRSMQRDARRLEMLVADVLDLSRMERGKFSIELEKGSLVAVIKELVQQQRPRYEDAGISIALNYEPDFPEIEIDAFAVERACANILENIRRYAAGGGVAEISILRAKGHGLVVTICDRGPGIPESWQQRVLEPYERLPSTESMAAGAGLGLALVKAVMVAHGGSVSVANRTDGNGACFRLEFPSNE